MEYKQTKLWGELHTRIKMLASQSGMTINQYLDDLTIDKPILTKSLTQNDNGL